LETNESGLEQRVSSLQEQIQHLRRTTDRRPLEERRITLTEFGAAILKRWAVTADRHAAAVSQFEAHLHALGDTGSRLQEDTSQRLEQLEQIIQQEWDSLRLIHEVPVKQLVAQAASLTEVCIATANSAQHGFDRAEARLAALESEFHRSTSELTREVQNAVAELRGLSQNRARQLPGEAAAWPLEDVTRLHSQLRDTQGVHVTEPRALTAPEPQTGPAAPADPPNIATPTAVSPFSRLVAADPPKARRLALIACAALLLIFAGWFGWRLENQVRASAERLNETQRQLRETTETAARQINETQVQANRAISAAQELTTRAQMISDVLAAPDLIRFPLVGQDSLESATGQVLWSRSRGIFVFSASGLPTPPQDSTYQVWMLTRTGAVSVATFDPDSGGRATVTATPKVPPLVGAMVTMERKGGNDTPSGEPLLTRAPLVSSGA